MEGGRRCGWKEDERGVERERIREPPGDVVGERMREVVVV